MKLKRAASLSVIALILCSCSTIEIMHVPVGCEGQPIISHNFTEEEAEILTDDMVDKMTLFAVTLRERIETQCAINHKHDEAFK